MSDAPEQPEQPERKDDDDAWIEKVVNIAGSLGFNKMRLRWKLIRWQEKRRKERRRREQVVQHITYAHKTCGECGAIQDKDEQVCTSCGAKLGKRGWQVLGRLGIAMPVALSVSTLLAMALLAAYGRVWVAAGGGLGSPSVQLLIDFGGRFPPAIEQGEWWRHLTAVFLHAGLLHIAFNLLAIATIGPRIEELYGRWTTLGLFVITGVLANIATLQVAGFGVGIGASGGVMGLIGVAAGAGQRAGTTRGRALRDDMLKWSAYTFIFGFGFGADNWAHLFGLVAGAAFGFAVVPATWTRKKALLPLRALAGAIGVAGTVAALALIFTRQPTPVDEHGIPTADQHEVENTIREGMQGYADICKKLYANDLDGAIAATKKLYAGAGDEETPFEVTAESLDGLCDSIQSLREQCTRDRTTMSAESKRAVQDMCSMYKPLFDTVPVRPPKHPAPVP